MDMRELKALEIAARSRITCADGVWSVPSQTGSGAYRVIIWGSPSCSCPDFELTQKPCKHIHAARLVAERDGVKAAPIVVDEVPKRKTYKQDWPKYNLAQETEKDRFQELLFELCQGVEEPPRHNKGAKRIWMKDMVFASAFKVFSTFSGRRFACDLKDATERGMFTRPMSASTVAYFLEDETMTPHLYRLIEQSALPLRSIETTFAPDSTGFSTSRFVRWYSEKYGCERSGRAYVKAHAMTGTTTNIVSAVIIDGPTAGDAPMFRPLLEKTIGNGFTVKDVCADKGYLSNENLELAVRHGAIAYIPFKSNSVPGEPGTLWDRMFGYFQFNRADFLKHYHARSNVESTFAMIKAKFRDHVRSKNDTAMKNEVLLKFLCHNIVVVHQSMIELGIDGTFWPEKEATAARNVLKFDRWNQTGIDGITG